MEFSLIKQTWQDGALTSFALYDLYCTYMAHKQ